MGELFKRYDRKIEQETNAESKTINGWIIALIGGVVVFLFGYIALKR